MAGNVTHTSLFQSTFEHNNEALSENTPQRQTNLPYRTSHSSCLPCVLSSSAKVDLFSQTTASESNEAIGFHYGVTLLHWWDSRSFTGFENQRYASMSVIQANIPTTSN